MRRWLCWESLIGPLAGWELVRLARRGQAHRSRQMVVYIVAVGFVLLPILWFPWADPLDLFLGGEQTIHPGEAARFAERFALVVIEAILLAVVLLTPAYAAVSLAEEKARNTLLLLRTTDLSDREIVLGKAAGRLVFALAAAAAGLPVLAATMLFGGVSVGLIGGSVLIIASTAALTTAIGLWAGASSKDVRSAVIRAYWVTALLAGGGIATPLVFLSPFVLISYAVSEPDDAPVIFGGYPVLQLVVAGIFLSAGVKCLRSNEDDTPPGPPPPPIPPESDSGAEESPRPVVRRKSRLPRMNEESPLLWKERYVPRTGTDGGTLARIMFSVLAVLFLGLGAARMFAFEPSRYGSGIGMNPAAQMLTSGGVFAAGLFLVPAAVGLSGAVARERQRQTLETLLTLPNSRAEILRAKVWAAVESGWWWPIVAAAAVGAAFGVTEGWRFGLGVGGCVLAGCGFVVGLGAAVTVRCRSEILALRLLVPAVVLVVGLPVGLMNFLDELDPAEKRLASWAVGGLAVGLAVAGPVLWRWACRTFERAVD